jgi:lipoprotein-anchoring transpeptidase ErfK/SrfK
LAKFVGVTPSACDHAGLGTLRTALISGVALAVLAVSVGSADAAPRRSPYFYYGYPAPSPAFVARRAPASPAAPGAAAAAVKKPNPEKDGFPDVPKGGVLQIAISISSQRLTLFHDGVPVAHSPVSTGTASHPTPTGVFSVIEKDRFHRSNLYGNAPMFFMQRVTWSGVAMHEGVLPGHAASHGCIRLPTEFAARLWPTTKLGVRVVISKPELAPVTFAHPALFVPKAKPAEPKIAMIPTTDGFDGTRPIVLAQATMPETATVRSDASPAAAAKPAPEDLEEAKAAGFGSVPVVPATPAEETVTATGTVAPAKPAAAAPPVEPSELRKSVEVPPAAEPATKPAEAAPAAEPIPAAATPGSEPVKPAPVIEPPKPVAPRTKLSDQPAKRGGQVAVFVSRKEKKIFVRQGSIPILDMPITFATPDQPLGTHVFTAIAFTENGAGMRWNLITVPNDVHRVPEPRDPRKKGKEPPRPVETKPPSTAAEALERIQMPKEAAERVSELLIPGSSLVISDEGLGRETGRMTEFIVLTR